jgi:hypothetical protein
MVMDLEAEGSPPLAMDHGAGAVTSIQEGGTRWARSNTLPEEQRRSKHAWRVLPRRLVPWDCKLRLLRVYPHNRWCAGAELKLRYRSLTIDFQRTHEVSDIHDRKKEYQV